MFGQAAARGEMTDGAEVDFFGAHIKVKSAKLAALLNSALTDDVVVVGKRALDLVSAEQCDEELDYVLDAADTRPGPATAADESDESLDRVFARRGPPPAQR
jgi:hypothetical protein